MKKEQGKLKKKAKKKRSSCQLADVENITQFLETQYSLFQVGILPEAFYCATLRFQLFLRKRIGTVGYCAAFYARSVELDAQM